MLKKFSYIFFASLCLFFDITMVNADELDENEVEISGYSTNCVYSDNIVFTNEDGELSGSFNYNGMSCNKTIDYENDACPAYVLVQTPHNGTCSVTFSEEQRTRNYIPLREEKRGCFYYMQGTRYTFTRNHDAWDVIMNPDVGRSVDIADSLNERNECPQKIYISFPTGNIVHFDLRSGTGNNGSDRNEGVPGEDWEQLGEDVTPDDFNKDVKFSDIFDLDTPGSFGNILNTILNYIKIIGPILVVLLSAVDFVRAVVGTDEKAMKEAQNKLVIRLVAAIGLFLVPTLVQLLLSFINISVETIG